MDNTCVCCGESIPEGRQVCHRCENVKREDDKNGKLDMVTNSVHARHDNVLTSYIHRILQHKYGWSK